MMMWKAMAVRKMTGTKPLCLYVHTCQRRNDLLDAKPFYVNGHDLQWQHWDLRERAPKQDPCESITKALLRQHNVSFFSDQMQISISSRHHKSFKIKSLNAAPTANPTERHKTKMDAAWLWSCLLDNVLGPNIKMILTIYPLDMENKAINDKYAISDFK